ncbi:MAG: hypothetical protein ACREXK_00090 [Gammaproteobacteria bacterium]
MSSTVHGIVAGLALPALAAVCPEALANDRHGAMEIKLRQMQREMDALQQELDRMRTAEGAQDQRMESSEIRNSTQHQEITDRVTKVEEAPGKRTMKNLVFFRGGYVDYADDGARGFESFTDVHDVDGAGQALGFNEGSADGGWYVGASIEHSLTDNLWGLLPHTEALGEISLEFKRFGSEEVVLVVPAAECSLLVNATAFDALESDGGCLITGNDTITMFTVSAAPKIKFLEGHPWKLRPWIIPAGLDFHVISPPSDAATVLDVGVQFAGGVEYEIIPGIKLGIDARYHLTANETDTNNNTAEVLQREARENPNLRPLVDAGVFNFGNTDHDNSFWTTGAYLGFAF